MKKSDVKKIKENIIKCLTEDTDKKRALFGKNRSLYDPDKFCTYDEVELTEIMDYIVSGLYMSIDEE